MKPFLFLAVDQGTTSTRSIVFRSDLSVAAMAQEEIAQRYPFSGWVEHDPEQLWSTALSTMRTALGRAKATPAQIAAIGLTNQRETTLLWDRQSGRPIANAIVWQDRRTAAVCARMRADGWESALAEKTGLLLDPYFSATKIGWLLDNVAGARAAADRGRLAFGTVDSFLLWHLTAGLVHATDATNAARTGLFDIHRGSWDEELCRLFQVPSAILPKVMDSADEFGTTHPDILGRPIAIRAMAGDQHAAMVGQACFARGMAKVTYGTGAFALLNTGTTPVRSTNRLVTTIAYQLAGKRVYALEGTIFVAGAAVQWLRDGLGLISAASDTEVLAQAADETQGIYLVPAFVGLGAPYWDPDARGALFGLTRNTGPKELARAVLESVGYQTRDLVEAMHADLPESSPATLRVDGGMAASDWTMQFIADILGTAVDRPKVMETTALGVAYLAGLAQGVLPAPNQFADLWKLDRRFTPLIAAEMREQKFSGWRAAVHRTLSTDR